MKRSRRLTVAVLLVSSVLFSGQAALAVASPEAGEQSESPDSGTLVSIQSYGSFANDNGQVLLVRDGEVVWRYDPPNSRVFDAEMLDNGNVLVTVAQRIPNEDCPQKYQHTEREPGHCVKNRVVEVDYDTRNVVWEHSWYDAFIDWHEVHDADRLPSGETAIADMGNNRAFTVAKNGTITWEWHAQRHIGRGSDFFERYVPEGQRAEFTQHGPEDDWTHMNDIDRLANGNFTLSIRNFDVVLEVDPETNEIVDVVGRPGEHATMNEQHNPNALERRGTMLIADSENDRVVEVASNGTQVWAFDGSKTERGKHLQWPRDADRLPNGHTLIADSLNFRVVEIDRNGNVVWSFSVAERRGIVYSADRLGVPEEPDAVPSGRVLTGGTTAEGDLVSMARQAAAWASFVLPPWVGVTELVTLLLGAFAGGVLLVDVGREQLRRV